MLKLMPLIFFFSGLAALIYELLWFRQLGLILGNTVYAATAVLAAFMTGLSIGSWLGGHYGARSRHPYLLFGILEFGIGASALLIPILFSMLPQIYLLIPSAQLNTSPVTIFIKSVLSMFILLIPTVCMGASLPVLAKDLLQDERAFGKKLGLLYGINTLGGALGVLACGFFLIPAFGLHNSNLIAVALNLTIGCVSVIISKSIRINPLAQTGSPARRKEPLQPLLLVILLAVGLSGFLSLGFEVIWFRALVLIFGSTTYSFAAMLCIFLIGMAAGGMLLSRISEKIHHAVYIFACTEIAIFSYTLWSMCQFDRMPEFLLHFLSNTGFSWSGMISAKFLISIFFLFIPTFLFGVDVPIAARAIRNQMASASKTISITYVFNTIGAVAGSFFAGFILLPRLGIENSLLLLAGFSGTLGFALLFAAKISSFARLMAATVFLMTLAFGLADLPDWDKELLNSGPYFTPTLFIENGTTQLKARLDEERLLYYCEGKVATVGVVQTDDMKLKYVSDGKIEADTSLRSMTLQRMQGHIPMLFHPNPKRVLNIGLGAGVTLGALSCYPVDFLQVVEIEPAAVDVARYFSSYNHGVINNPDIQIIIDDGRNYILTSTNRYDVITSDPFEPVHSGAGHLYTVEHFRRAREKLNENGIMGQFLPLYELSEKDYEIVLRSFLEVFPHTAVFYTGDDTILLGFKSQMPLTTEYATDKFNIPAVHDSLSKIGFLSVNDLLGMFVTEIHHVPDSLKQTPLNTDNHPLIEFSAPKHALTITTDQNQSVLLDLFKDLSPSFLNSLSGDTARMAVTNTHAALLSALKANVERTKGNTLQSIQLLREANRRAPENPVIRNRLADVLMIYAQTLRKQQNWTRSMLLYKEVLSLRPDEFWANFHLIREYLKMDDFKKSGEALDYILSVYPDSGVLYSLKGFYEYRKGNVEGTLQAFTRAIELYPDKAAIRDTYAGILQRFGKYSEAAEQKQMAEKIRARF